MITVKAGTMLGRARDEAIRRLGCCQAAGCRKKTKLKLHHKHRKADVFRDIVKNHSLTFGPDAPIRNILRGFTLLLNHRQFRGEEYVTLLCKTHHDAEHGKKSGKKNGNAGPRRRGYRR